MDTLATHSVGVVLEKAEMIFAVIIGFVSAVVLVGSLFKYGEVSDALMDSYPSGFQEEPLQRIAFPIFVRSPSTPLHLQAGYLQAMAGICFVLLSARQRDRRLDRARDVLVVLCDDD